MTTLRFLAMLSLAFLLSGCAYLKLYEIGTMKEPELKFYDYRIQEVTLNNIRVDLVFRAINPNHYDIDTFKLAYQFHLADQQLAEGKDILVTLIPEGESEVIIPVQVHYDKLFTTVNSLSKLIRSNAREAPGKVHIRIYGDYVYAEWFGKKFTNEYNFETDVDMQIPLPEITMNNVKKQIKDVLRNLLD